MLDQDAAALIREAGLRVLEGERVAYIAEDFEKRGLAGPGGNGWEPGYLARMLRNPIYKGEGRYRVREYVEPETRRKPEHAQRRTQNSTRIRPKEEWIVFEIPAVFSETEWETIQATLGSRTKPHVEAGSYLLSRRFHSACGSKYHGNYNNGKTRYLCRNRNTRKRTGNKDCGCPAIPSHDVDDAAWRTVLAVLAEPSRLLTTAREELSRRGLEKSEAKMRQELKQVDGQLTQKREALARLVRFHAEKGDLSEGIFESAAQPLKDEITRLEQRREKLLSALPDVAWKMDESAFSALSVEFSDRLNDMGYSEKQRLFALLDVQVHIEADGRVAAFLSAPRSGEDCQRKVFSCTSSQDCSETYRDEPVRYEFQVMMKTGTPEIQRSRPRGSWSRRHDACKVCGTQSRPHAGNGHCQRCFAREYAHAQRLRKQNRDESEN